MRFLICVLVVTTSNFLFSQSRKSILKKYPKEVQSILLTEEGVFRGINFDEKKENVKSKEKLKLHSESDTLLLYTLYLDADDSADLIYYLDSNSKVKGFAIVFILSDPKEEQAIRNGLTNFYNEKFGQYTIMNEEDELWDTQKGYLIEMRDTTDEAGMEIEVAYYKNEAVNSK